MKLVTGMFQALMISTGAVAKCKGLHVRLGFFPASRYSVSRRQPPSMSALQGMFDSLSAIPNVKSSTNNPWSCEMISKCVNFMDKVSLSDLSLVGYPIKGTVCMEVAATPYFQIAAFVLPKGRTLPVHDHPDMTVISKVVSGELSVVSFSEKNGLERMTGKLSFPVTLQDKFIKTTVDKPWMISPTLGNYHEFTGKSDCIILDVLLPPYAYPERPCTYYRASPSTVASDKDAWNLSKISEKEAHQQYGLPIGVPYHGYVPKDLSV